MTRKEFLKVVGAGGILAALFPATLSAPRVDKVAWKTIVGRIKRPTSMTRDIDRLWTSTYSMRVKAIRKELYAIPSTSYIRPDGGAERG